MDVMASPEGIDFTAKKTSPPAPDVPVAEKARPRSRAELEKNMRLPVGWRGGVLESTRESSQCHAEAHVVWAVLLKKRPTTYIEKQEK